MTEFLWLLPLILALVAWEGWMLYEARRPRGSVHSGGDHVHQGTKRSEHEAGGKRIAVVECRQCGGHFNHEVD